MRRHVSGPGRAHPMENGGGGSPARSAVAWAGEHVPGTLLVGGGWGQAPDLCAALSFLALHCALCLVSGLLQRRAHRREVWPHGLCWWVFLDPLWGPRF